MKKFTLSLTVLVAIGSFSAKADFLSGIKIGSRISTTQDQIVFRVSNPTNHDIFCPILVSHAQYEYGGQDRQLGDELMVARNVYARQKTDGAFQDIPAETDHSADMFAAAPNIIFKTTNLRIDLTECMPATFSQYCSMANLSEEERHTIDVLSDALNASDCHGLEKKLRKVKKIDIAGRKIVSLRPLAFAQRMERLRASKNPISSIWPLQKLPKLKAVELTHTDVVDSSEFLLLKKLQILDVSSTKVDSLKGFETLDKLWSLNISNTGVRELGLLAQTKHLRCFRAKGQIFAESEDTLISFKRHLKQWAHTCRFERD